VLFIVPVRKHGKRMKELLKETQSRYAKYRMKAKPSLLLTIAIAVNYAKGRRGKHGVENPATLQQSLVEPQPGAPDLSIPVLDLIVLPDAQSGETRDEHEEPGDPLSLCDHLFLLRLSGSFFCGCISLR